MLHAPSSAQMAKGSALISSASSIRSWGCSVMGRSCRSGTLKARKIAAMPQIWDAKALCFRQTVPCHNQGRDPMCNCHDHDHDTKLTRRAALTGTAAMAAAATGLAASGAQAQDNPYA